MDLNPETVRRILTSARTIASVGVSASPMKDSHWIAHYLQFQGYTVYPVNPTADTILGVKSYPDLASLPEAPDVVQLFRRSEDVPPIVEQAIAKGAKVIWMQAGIVNEEAAAMARAAGLEVVMDLCMRAAHQFLIGDKGWHAAIEEDEHWIAFTEQW